MKGDYYKRELKKKRDRMVAWQESVFKTNKVNFYLLIQRFCWQSFIKPEGLTQELFLSEF